MAGIRPWGGFWEQVQTHIQPAKTFGVVHGERFLQTGPEHPERIAESLAARLEIAFYAKCGVLARAIA